MDLGELRRRGLLELLDVELARALGRSNNNHPAVDLAIALTSRNVRNGHSCFPISLPAAAIWPGERFAEDPLPTPDSWARILRASPLAQNGPIVIDEGRRLYLRRYYELEQRIAAQLAARSAPFSAHSTETSTLERRLGELFADGRHSPQAEAGRRALRERVSLLCGGPGTGKTTTVAAIVALLVEERERGGDRGTRVMLLAPTGKAAARLGEAVRQAKQGVVADAAIIEAIPNEARTIQRALGLRRAGMRFEHDADRPLEADVIVVDEASMVDLALMHQLLEATPLDARLLIVGDPDQLTSVEAGSVTVSTVGATMMSNGA